MCQCRCSDSEVLDVGGRVLGIGNGLFLCRCGSRPLSGCQVNSLTAELTSRWPHVLEVGFLNGWDSHGRRLTLIFFGLEISGFLCNRLSLRRALQHPLLYDSHSGTPSL